MAAGVSPQTRVRSHALESRQKGNGSVTVAPHGLNGVHNFATLQS